MSDCALLPSSGETDYHSRTDSGTPTCDPSTEQSAGRASTPTETNSNQTDDNASLPPEAPLRRSKRSKGRVNHASSANNNTNLSNNLSQNNGICDERVTFCTVDGVEYHTGDFVYYEEPDFEYFTIGQIEEIKLSRRDRFTLTVKCFYRTHDIPEFAKHSILDREFIQSSTITPSQNEVLSRELFVSEVQETLASKQLRGLCNVSHLSDLKTALTTFVPNEEDSFFYVFAYNPETRRLVNTRAEIRVGDAFQASIPDFRHPAPATYRLQSHRHERCSKHCHRRHHHRGTHWKQSADVSVKVAPSSPCTKKDEDDALPVRPDLPMERAPSITNEQYGLSDSELKPNRDSESLKSPPTLENFGPQALPPVIQHPSRDWHKATSTDRQILRKHRRRFETPIWKPQGLTNVLSGANPEQLLDERLADEPLKTYLDAVRSTVAFFGFGGADDDISSAHNGLVLANLATTTQHAYDTLHQCGYSLEHALQSITHNPIPSKDTPRHWTADQVRLFAHALRIHGKDFHAIQRDFFGGRLSSDHVRNQIGLLTSTGRPRGRGGRRKTVSNSSKSKNEEQESGDVKPEDAASGGLSGEDTKQSDPSESGSTHSTQPIKTVKQLISFYYYWKRKGAAAGTGSMIGPVGNPSLVNATVNFAAAVAASADVQAGSYVSTRTTAVSEGVCRKRRPLTSRGNAPRAPTPSSELSESADPSQPESEAEDGMDSADPRATESGTETDVDPNKTVTDSPVTRLRRRPCRNCGSDLSPPNELAQTSIGQLRFLCHECRIHLQKYGELRLHSMGSADDVSAADRTPVSEAGDGLSKSPTQRLPATSSDTHLPNPGCSPHSFCSPFHSSTCSNGPESCYSSTSSPYAMLNHSDSTSCCSGDDDGHSVDDVKRMKRRRVRSRADSESLPKKMKREAAAVTKHSDPPVSAATEEVLSSPVQAEAIDSETESELAALATAPHTDPIACTIKAHNSTWSRLLRVWDRSIQLPIVRSNGLLRLVNNSGTCARTDLIYSGRPGSSVELMTARQDLCRTYPDTLIGPGASAFKSSSPSNAMQVSKEPEQSGTQPITAKTPLQQDPSAALNLSSKPTTTTRSPEPLGRFSNLVPSATTGSGHLPPSFSTPRSTPASRNNPSPIPNQLTHNSPGAYDPFYTHQYIHTAYEQSMLLAAAASQQHQNRDTVRQPHPFNAARSTPSTKLPVQPSMAQLSAARLGAAAGTFFPPAVVSSASGNMSAPVGRAGTSTNPFSPMLHSQALWNAASGNAHSLGQSASSSGPHVGSAADDIWNNPELLQRQLALLGMAPDMRELEFMRRFIDGRANSNRSGPNSSTHLGPSIEAHLQQQQQQQQQQQHHPQQQLQQQHPHPQALMAALLAANEILLRNRDPLAFNPPLCHSATAGANTSAVVASGSSTRPTAALQSPSFRNASASSNARPSYVPPAMDTLHPGFPPYPLSSPQSGRGNPSPNYMSLLAASHPNTQTRPAGSHSNTGPVNMSNFGAGSRNPMSEQMLNAARLAMLSAQSDPNKALSLNAILAEMAAMEKTQSRQAHQASSAPTSHLLQHQPTPPPHPLDFRGPSTPIRRRADPDRHPSYPSNHSRNPSGNNPRPAATMMSDHGESQMTPSFPQLAQLHQLANLAGADPSVLNALALAAVAAHAAGPSQSNNEALSAYLSHDAHHYNRQNTHARQVASPAGSAQIQQAAAAAAMAALPHLFGQQRFPSSHS